MYLVFDIAVSAFPLSWSEYYSYGPTTDAYVQTSTWPYEGNPGYSYDVYVAETGQSYSVPFYIIDPLTNSPAIPALRWDRVVASTFETTYISNLESWSSNTNHQYTYVKPTVSCRIIDIEEIGSVGVGGILQGYTTASGMGTATTTNFTEGGITVHESGPNPGDTYLSNYSVVVADVDISKDPIEVWIEDEAVSEGNSGTTTVNFEIHISKPITQGSLTVVLAEINPAFDLLKTNTQLRYKNSSGLTDDIFDPTFGPSQPASVRFTPTTGTVLEIEMKIRGDGYVEPDEKFSVRIIAPFVTEDGRLVKITDDVATGTIINDDGANDTPKGKVTWRGADDVSSDLRDYVTADIEAAIARLDASLAGRLPSLEVIVQPWSLPSDVQAAAVPVFTRKIAGLRDDDTGKNNLTMVLPLAEYEKLTGKDLNKTGPDLKIFINMDQMDEIYSGGQSSIDGTSPMLHEIMHGLGVGVSGRAQYQTPWYHYEPSKNGPRLTKDGAHLVSPDLLDPEGTEPNEILEQHRIKILNYLGYGPKAPNWWTGKNASKPSGFDEPDSPSAFKMFESSDAAQAEHGLYASRDVRNDWLLA